MDIVNLLSMSTTGLCLFLKLPQILTVIQTSSVQGLSRTSLMLEFWSYSTTLSYSMFFGYHFKMFSEYPPLILQDLILFLLIMRSDRESQELEQQLIQLKKTDSPSKTTNNGKTSFINKINKLNLFITFTIAVHAMIALRFFPRVVPIILLSISSPIGVISKFLQLWEIMSKKTAGSVSAASWFLNFISSLCRLVSVLMTVRDMTIVYSLAASAILNLAVSMTALYYNPRRRRSDTKDQRDENDTKNNNIHAMDVHDSEDDISDKKSD